MPDQIQAVRSDGTIQTLTDPRNLFDFVFEPTLRVVRREGGYTVATAGNVYEIGFEDRPDGSFGLCGDFTYRTRGFPPLPVSPAPPTS